MTTRIGQYCERVMEAGWLAAVIVTPLFYNVYSSRVFEPDKLTLLRSIALLMAVAWLIRRLEAVQTAVREASDDEVDVRAWLGGAWRSLIDTPLALQVLLLIVIYLLATLASIAPRISFWGSYQRLQGTYTLLAYLVVFFVAIETLRTRAQLERLLNVIVLTSLPIALYGIIQHMGRDPLPWGGDVVERVTGNLGNAIFIAAYLIMAFFVTLERTVARFRRMLVAADSSTVDALMGASYLFILAVQALAIYYSKSRGPWLGLLGGFYIFVFIALVALRRSAAGRQALTLGDAGKGIAFGLLSPLLAVIPGLVGLMLGLGITLALVGLVGLLGAYLVLIIARRGRRWLWLSWFTLAVLAIAFLGAFNLVRGPLEPLRQIPGIGRLGQILETDTGTGRVRLLIWEGSIELIKSDPLRALIGYGPESMYMAFNPFYPPDLAHYEARNASPDRAHNETFDALINTGIIGFLVYMWLFASIFYYALRWLGFLPTPLDPPVDGATKGGRRRRYSRQQVAFVVLAVAGAALGVLGALAFDGSLKLAGVGIPAGLIVGVILYLVVSAFASSEAAVERPSFGQRELLLAGLLAMIVAHFVEIHFGIAIAATRIYFWLGLAVLISLGSGRLDLEPGSRPAVETPRPQPLAARPGQRKRKHRAQEARSASARLGKPPAWPLEGAVAGGVIGALVLGTVLFDYTINLAGERSPLRILWISLAGMTSPDRTVRFAPAILGVLILTWLLGAVLLVIGEGENREERPRPGWLLRALGLYLGISLLGGLALGLVHAGQLAPQSPPQDIGLCILTYYVFVFAAILAAAFFLPGWRPASLPFLRKGVAWSYPLLVGACIFLINGNANVVRADMYYKQAWDYYHKPASDALSAGNSDLATIQRMYENALYYYDRALHYAPDEDYYLLFFGKAFLELAEVTQDSQQQLQLLQKSKEQLELAHSLNPLNTDHTANLARLYRTWAAGLKDPATQQAKLVEAERYSAEAVKLSPHNAVLYDEWGQTLLALGRTEEGLAKYQRSLELDDRFVQTYVLLGEHYLSQGEYPKALPYYERAAELEPRSLRIHNALGNLYSETGDYEKAIGEFLTLAGAAPTDYKVQQVLAGLYSRTGQNELALQAATLARDLAPQEQRAALQALVDQLQAASGQETQK